VPSLTDVDSPLRSFAPRRQRIARWLHSALTTDHFPRADRFLRRVLWNTLGGLFLALGVSLLCAYFLHPRAFVPAFGLLALLLMGAFWPWTALCGLRAVVSFRSERIREGETVEVYGEVFNRLPWGAWGVLIGDGELTLMGFSALPGRRTTRRTGIFSPPGRGAFPRAVPRLRTGFPFGLFEARRAARVEKPLLVWPRTFVVPALPEAVGENCLEGAVSRRRAGTTGDVLGVRPYRRGDSPRRMHWAQSARHDRLMVCELESTARPLVLIALDDDPAVHGGAGTDGSREWAIRIAASLCESWLAQGAEVAGLFHGRFLPPSAGATHQRAFLDELALLPDTAGPGMPQLLRDSAWRDFGGIRVLITTDRSLAALGAGGLPEGVRVVALHADAFAGMDSPAVLLPLVPWLWIDDPSQVPAQAGSTTKETGNGR
jgi:uncharacterized protein (DUF58 family)